MSETSPLLSELSANKSPPAKDVYDRFSDAQKRVILMIVSQAGLLAFFPSGCFVPCVPKIAKDLSTTGTVINYAVGVYMFTFAIGGLVCAPYASYYGRRAVYLVFLPIFCVGCLGTSMSESGIQLAMGCTFQGFGASCLIPVGAATVSDIYRLEKRGTGMGVFIGITLLGPALAPIIGGISATYYSWRTMQLILFAMGFVSFTSIAALFPETLQPGTAQRITHHITGDLAENSTLRSSMDPKRKWVWLNPLTTAIALLRSPNIFLVALASSLVLVTYYVLILPLSYTLGPRYGVTSPALIGLCLLPTGAGDIVGATVGGRLADRAVVRGLRQRGGKWVPEDRLRATLSTALLLVPFSVLVFGLTTQFVPGRIGLVIDLICLFMNGAGVDMVLSITNTYTVDILHDRSAEVVAVTIAFRNVVSAFASAAVLPTIKVFGVASTNGLVAAMAWIAFGILVVIIRYGDRFRACIDIGFTTTVLTTT